MLALCNLWSGSVCSVGISLVLEAVTFIKNRCHGEIYALW